MTTDTVGGVFSYAVTLCRALIRRGVQVALATEGARLERDQRGELLELSGLLVCESQFALEWMDAPWRDVDASGEWLLTLERGLAPDVVHVNGFAHAALPFHAPALIVAHSSVPSWWHAVLGEEAPARYAEYRRRVQLAFGRAAHVVAPSRSMLRALAQHDGFAGAASIIPNGVEPERFRCEPKEAFVLAAGRLWDRAKNLELLEAAAAELDCPVYVAGAAPAPGVAVRCQLLGRVPHEDLVGWLARAPIFAHPARYEPFGLAPLEAALSRCALVLGDIDSLREIWGDAALYVHPDDARGLSRELNRLVRDPALARELGERAYQRAARYSADAMAEAYVGLYRGLSARSGAARPVKGLA